MGLLAFFTFQGKAQPTKNIEKGPKITGRVLDSVSRSAMDYATVTIFPEGSKKPVNGTMTDSTGEFTLAGLKSGNYSVLIESIGYHSHRLNHITITK